MNDKINSGVLRTFKALIVLLSIGAPHTQAMSQIVSSTNVGELNVANSNAEIIEEIIVTAERRAKNLQRVPITITALTGDHLEESLVADTMDMQILVPGYTFKTNSLRGQPYIRGVGSDVITVGAESSVAFFQDGVYLPRASSALIQLYDVERVEVVKGPQGTLFGRNATGGAVHVISKKPSDSFEAGGDLTLGNHDQLRLTGYLNLPIDAQSSFRLSGLLNRHDGHLRNVFRNIDVNSEDVVSLRGQYQRRRQSDAEIRIAVSYFDQDDSGPGLASHPDPENGINLGLLPPFNGEVRSNPREVTHNEKLIARFSAWSTQLTVTKPFRSTELQSLTSYSHIDSFESLDLDASDADFASNMVDQWSKAFTQEFQLTSEINDNFNWLVGLFFLNEQASQILDIEVLFPAPPEPSLPDFLPARNKPGATVSSEALGVFGQGSYRIGEKWRATAGFRYSYDRRSQNYLQEITDPFGILGGSTTIRSNDRDSWNSWTPKVVFEYLHSADVMAYLSISSGYKAGGFNTNTLQGSFDEENLWAYELGLKSSFKQRRVQLNVAGFYYDYDDIQLLTLPPGAAVGTFPIVINAAEARYAGVEFDLSTRVTKQADVDVHVAWLDAQFDRFVAMDPNNPQDGELNRSGYRLQQAPELSASVRAQYTWNVSRSRELSFAAEYAYQAKVFFNTFQDNVVSQDGYSLVNARLELESKDERWFVALWGKNITDRLYAHTKIRQDPLVGNLRFWGPPRTYGIQFGRRH